MVVDVLRKRIENCIRAEVGKYEKKKFEEGLSKFYERVYFHEIDTRDRLNSRLQLPFAVIVSLVGILGYFLRQIDVSQDGLWVNLFYLFFVYSSVTLFIAVYLFIKASHGNVYSLIPTSKKTNEYHAKLSDFYREYDTCEELTQNYFEQYMNNTYIECASKNTKLNEKRSALLHGSNNALIVTIVLTVITFLFWTIRKSAKNRIYRSWAAINLERRE
ncbi:MAG: hypothetical protein KTR28_04665 [Micavibrio sp.]|nr:hypothetical protein [Micavibrio sp.]